MTIVVVADELQKEELLAQGINKEVQIHWSDKLLPVAGADCYIDLLFNAESHTTELSALHPALIIVNDVYNTNDQLPAGLIRINGWATFLKRPVVEAACTDTGLRTKAEKIFEVFNKKTEWVADIPGFISPRVVTTIINEAYITLEEKVSSKTEIDTAMKLGTNYPYGPFEWSEKIGLKKIYNLLSILAQTNKRYEPSPLLKKEALQ